MSNINWQAFLRMGIESLMMTEGVQDNIHPDHIKDTANRVVTFFEEFLWGYSWSASKALATTNGDNGFVEEAYDQMIVVSQIDFVSLCAHHLLPFSGKAHFGYLPAKRVVGLSKIPRLIEVFSHRLQLQEQLTQQIVNAFQEEVQPMGCGLIMQAEHSCMSIRGVQKSGAITTTNALTGVFLDRLTAKQEFFATVNGGMRR